MSKQEKIVCAALKTTGTDGVCERVLISVGVDYNFIQEQEGYEHFYDTETVLKEVRGFITNKNRFVDPVEAMEIYLNTTMALDLPFIEMGDIGRRMLGIEGIEEWDRIKDFYNRDHLLPEDLY